jgi:endonuclease YncB( thermonuclease family)
MSNTEFAYPGLTLRRLRRLLANMRANLAGLVESKAVVAVWSKKDRYFRILDTVLLGSTNINLEQMKAGCVWYFKRYAADVPEIERLQYEAAEAEAREAKRSLWQQQQAIPPLEWLHWRESVRLPA